MYVAIENGIMPIEIGGVTRCRRGDSAFRAARLYLVLRCHTLGSSPRARRCEVQHDFTKVLKELKARGCLFFFHITQYLNPR